MMHTNHPDDELLSALASQDEDVATDAELASHVAACARCSDLVDEIGGLRLSLASLPDVAPSRPLRLLPPVADPEPAAGVGTWIRRLFAPVMTAGAALALVGVVGTAAPSLGGMAASGGSLFEEVGTDLSAGQEDAAEDGAGGGTTGGAPAGEQPAASAASEAFGGQDGDSPTDDGEERVTAETDGRALDEGGGTDGAEELAQSLPAERSIWPMLLFTGVALMIGIALLRWILAPRGG